MAGKSSCYGCGNSSLDIHICDRCGNEFCPDCYDEDNELCNKCMQEQ